MIEETRRLLEHFKPTIPRLYVVQYFLADGPAAYACGKRFEPGQRLEVGRVKCNCLIETSKKWPSPNTLVKFAEIFKIEVYELLKPEYTKLENLPYPIKKYVEDIYLAISEVHKEYTKKPDTEKEE